MLILAPIQYLLGLFYVTCYYYVLPFAPLQMVLMVSYYARHSPEWPPATPETPLPQQ